MLTGVNLDYFQNYAGITPLQRSIIGTVVINPTVTNEDIARSVGCNPQTVRRLLADLEEKGFIEREVDFKKGYRFIKLRDIKPIVTNLYKSIGDLAKRYPSLLKYLMVRIMEILDEMEDEKGEIDSIPPLRKYKGGQKEKKFNLSTPKLQQNQLDRSQSESCNFSNPKRIYKYSNKYINTKERNPLYENKDLLCNIEEYNLYDRVYCNIDRSDFVRGISEKIPPTKVEKMKFLEDRRDMKSYEFEKKLRVACLSCKNCRVGFGDRDFASLRESFKKKIKKSSSSSSSLGSGRRKDVEELIEYWESLSYDGLSLPKFKSRETKSYQQTVTLLSKLLTGRLKGFPKLTKEQIKYYMDLHAKQALDPNYHPIGDFKETLRKLRLPEWIENRFARSEQMQSRLRWLMKHEGEVRRRDIPEDPNPKVTELIKSYWVKYRLGGVRPEKWTDDEEKGFRLICKKLITFYEKNYRRLSFGIIYNTSPLEFMVELMFDCIDEKMNGRWRNVTLGWFLTKRFWEDEFPAFLCDEAMLGDYQEMMERIGRRYC